MKPGILPAVLGDVDASNDALLRAAFIRTESYARTLDDNYCLIHGRKGTGKTAVVQMVPELESKRWTYIFAAESPRLGFKDIKSDFERGDNVLSKLSVSSFFEQLWEHFIYDNCMKLVLARQKGKAITGDLEIIHNYLKATGQLDGDAVTNIAVFLGALVSTIDPEFAVSGVQLKVGSGNALKSYFQKKYNYQNAVQALHAHLNDKKEDILFLVDDIDINIRSDSPKDIVREFFASLISTTLDISGPRMIRQSKTKAASRIHVKTFLPTDILLWLDLRHEDKMENRMMEITWSEAELTEMFCERLRQQCRLGRMPYDEVLRRHFDEKIYDDYGKARAVIPYMLENTFFRPRDILNLYAEIRSALQPDQKIHESDLYEAIQAYISRLVEHVILEYDFVEPLLRSVIQKFAGKPSVYSYNDVYAFLCSKEIVTVDPQKGNMLIHLLWEMGFFGVVKEIPSVSSAGIELHNLKIEYYYQKRSVALKRAKALVVHPVFRHELGLTNNVKEFNWK